MMRWIANSQAAGSGEIRGLITAAFWIVVLALMARRYQTKRQTAIALAIWASLVLSGVVLVRLLN